jgi:hypothetical protein
MHFVRTLVGLLAILSCFTAYAKTTKDLFSLNHIKVPFNISQPILPVNMLNNSGVELVVIGIDDDQQRWLAIYAFNEAKNQYTLFEKHIIPNKYFGYDSSEANKEIEPKNDLQQLYFIARDEVVVFNSNPSNKQQGGVFVKEKAINSMYLVEQADFLAPRDFIRDINDDGKDDIVLQDFESLNLWLSNCCGHYHQQKIPLKAFVSLRNNQVSFKQHQLYFADFNFDKKTDIAWVKQGKLEFFQQLANGEFSLQGHYLPLNKTIYGLNWWDIREADGDNLDQSKLAHRVVEKIEDINGDGMVDIVVRFTQSSGVLDRTNDYEFYFGKKNNLTSKPTLSYEQQASTVIKAEGTLTDLTIVDINNDNRFEVLLSSFELSITNIIGALISGSIDQDVLLFSLDQQGQFGKKPVTEKEVELSFSLSNGRSGSPVVILSDVNGDGLQDLLLSDDADTLKLYQGKSRGKAGKRLFAKKPIKQEIDLPQDGDNVKKYDLNFDGKQDFVMHYGRLDDATLINTFTLLIAN